MIRLPILAAALAFTGLGLAAPAPALADDPVYDLFGTIQEGALIRGRTDPDNTIAVDDVAVPVGPSGDFVFGLHRDRDKPVRIAITTPDGTVSETAYEVAQRDYDIERIDGLPDKMVTPLGKETLTRIKRESARKRAARPVDTPATDYAAGFIWPATGRISGTYGSQRILNGEPRNPHFGVDVAAPTGTPVKAPAAGVVTLAEDDMYFEGGLVFIDHGHGVIGVLMHLDTIDVTPGQRIAQGEIVGTVGATGRATGPHLDWRMYWRGARVDPTLLVPVMQP